MNKIVTSDLPSDCHPKIRLFYDYWRSIHPAAGGLPGRRHLDPVDIPTLLPNILMLDIPPGSTDFTFRLMGTRLDEFFCGNFTGKPLVGAFVKARQSQTYKDVCGIVQDRQPRWRRGPASFVRNREHLTTERLFLPLADDGATVDIILGLMLVKVGEADFV